MTQQWRRRPPRRRLPKELLSRQHQRRLPRNQRVPVPHLLWRWEPRGLLGQAATLHLPSDHSVALGSPDMLRDSAVVLPFSICAFCLTGILCCAVCLLLAGCLPLGGPDLGELLVSAEPEMLPRFAAHRTHRPGRYTVMVPRPLA
jgi:hypothetical protein